MNSRERQAREAVILKLIEGYPSLAGRATRGLIDAYVDASEHCDIGALNQACKRFARGEVPGQNAAFPPTAAEVAAHAAMLDELRKQTVVRLYNGLLDMDFGHGRVDLRGLTTEEQDQIRRDGGMIGKKNAALMSLDEKRAALRALPAPEADKTVPVPKMRRMTQ